MARRAHKVMPTGGKLGEDAVVVLQVACKQIYASDADGEGYLDFADGVMRIGVQRHGQVLFEDSSRITVKAEVLDYLIGAGGDCKRCIIFSRYAREVAAAICLWDYIGTNQITLAGADPWARESATGKLTATADGYVVLEGPPTVIVFKIVGNDTVYVMVDPANYGANDLDLLRSATRGNSDAPVAINGEWWLAWQSLPDQVSAVSAWVKSYFAAVATLDLGGFEHTAASQAMAGFRKQNTLYDIIVHDNDAVLKLERAALFGGRCEARFIGTAYCDRLYDDDTADDARQMPTLHLSQPIYHLDVNSLYPSVAVNAMLPVRLACVCNNVSISNLILACKNLAVVARVRIKTDVPCVPVEFDGRTIYPVGDFITTLCGPEILLANECGKIMTCFTAAIYQARPIYSAWVNTLYAARRRLEDQGNFAMAGVVKAVLNASFGKWAQRLRRWVSVPDELPPFPFYQWWQANKQTGDPEQWRAFAWEVQQMVDAGEPSESFPAITAYVSSLGRVRLWQDMHAAGLSNVFYYDTDSLWVNGDGFDAICDEGLNGEVKLGNYKVKGVHHQVTWYGHKRYVADGRLTLAGAGTPTYRVGDAFALQMKAPPCSHYLAHGEPPGLDRHISRVRINTPYNLGRVLPSGAVQPYRLVDRKIV